MKETESVLTVVTNGNSWECTHIKGDVNGDGIVNISDVIELVNIILGKTK